MTPRTPLTDAVDPAWLFVLAVGQLVLFVVVLLVIVWREQRRR